MRRGALLLLCFIALLPLVFPSASAANHVSYHWQWGFNNIGPNHTWESSGYNYWDDQYLNKQNGGTVHHGFDPATNCYRVASGVQQWHGYPSDLGCGGYIYNWVLYISGNTSYLYIDSYNFP